MTEQINVLAEGIAERDAQIARLKTRVFQLEAIIEFGSVRTLEQYESLLTRAADALEGKPVYDALANYNLIKELREAAQ